MNTLAELDEATLFGYYSLSRGALFPVPANRAKKISEKCVKSHDLIRLIGEISNFTKRKVRLNEQ